MTGDKTLYVVHCVDTEGPLDETLDATFDRLASIFGIKLPPTSETLALLQRKELNLDGMEDAVAKCFAPDLLRYNKDWNEITQMLDELVSDDFRRQDVDDFGNGWVYSWHCMDHIGHFENPRRKDVGFGNIFRFYKSILHKSGSKKDEINWHFHPLSLTKNPLHAATSYVNNYDILIQILCRRVLDHNWFPTVNRPGFHSERPDSHAFLEQWIPFDYANQFFEGSYDQPDLGGSRFGDWNRAPSSWRGYHPSHDDHQEIGSCRRLIFRCLNVGTRFRCLTTNHVHEAFSEAKASGGAILSFANHDYRDIRPDVRNVRSMLGAIRKQYPDVKLKYAGAEEAAISLSGYGEKPPPILELELIKNRLIVVVVDGEIFGPQPFLAILTKEGRYFHDNFDTIEPRKRWTYVFDDQTIPIKNLCKVGVATAGKFGRSCVRVLSF